MNQSAVHRRPRVALAALAIGRVSSAASELVPITAPIVAALPCNRTMKSGNRTKTLDAVLAAKVAPKTSQNLRL